MPEQMIGFEDALKQLQLSEDELQKLVTSGALRAFRSGGEMKFRASDLEAVKKERETEPTIIIPAAAADETAVGELKVEMPEDLVVDESAQTVVGGARGARGAGGDGGSPTVQVPDQGTEELVFDDKELEVLPLEEEAAGTQAAEAATVVESSGEDITVAADAGAEEGEGEAEAGTKQPSSRRRVLSSRVGPAASRRRSAAFEVRRGHPIMSGVLVLTAAAAVFVLSVFGVILIKGYRAAEGQPNDAMYVPNFLKGMFDDTKKWGEEGQ